MISLAAWITVSMSALSKLSTMKRPRCAAGTGGAVGGALGAGGGGSVGVIVVARGSSAGRSVRGPTDIGGSGAGVGGVVATGGARAGGGGGSGAGASTRGGLAVAQLLRKAARTTVATPRFTLLLWRIALRVLWETTQEIRRQRAASGDHRRLTRLHELPRPGRARGWGRRVTPRGRAR